MVFSLLFSRTDSDDSLCGFTFEELNCVPEYKPHMCQEEGFLLIYTPPTGHEHTKTLPIMVISTSISISICIFVSSLFVAQTAMIHSVGSPSRNWTVSQNISHIFVRRLGALNVISGKDSSKSTWRSVMICTLPPSSHPPVLLPQYPPAHTILDRPIELCPGI